MTAGGVLRQLFTGGTDGDLTDEDRRLLAGRSRQDDVTWR